MFPYLSTTTVSGDKGKGKERERDEDIEDDEDEGGSRSKRRKSGGGAQGENEGGEVLTTESKVSRKKIPQSECRLKSVKELRKVILENGHGGQSLRLGSTQKCHY